jgi:hypothetical protein
MQWSTNAWVSRERSLWATLCASRAKGGGPRHVLRRLQGGPLHAALKQGVVPETLGIMPVRIPGGDVRETLGQEGTEGVRERGRMPLVLPSRGTACGEATLAVDATQSEGTKGGRQGPTLTIGPYGRASEGRKTSLLWSRRGPKHTSGDFYGMAASHRPF